MQDIQPALDFLVIQMDGDVSRKEKPAHCWCKTTQCIHQGEWNPLECDVTPAGQAACPIVLPCPAHNASVAGFMSHLKGLLTTWLIDTTDTCIAIPCDSTEAWIVAAYDQIPDVEILASPWEQIISRGKFYHNIRIPGQKKRVRIFEQFVPTVCENWDKVTGLCKSAKDFENSLLTLI